VEVRVWHPPPPDWERQRVRNDDSVVLELRYGDVSVVLPGDIGAAVEQRLVASPPPPRLRVLKAAHHGSASSSSREWLRALAPSAVIYSAGRGNPFGHPAKAVVERAVRAGADVFRTDVDGAVHVATDGHHLAIETMSGRRWVRRAR
jgi:competence protein ComEC